MTRGKVLHADLRANGITDVGEVAVRHKQLEVFFDDRPLRLTRWPNDGFVKIVDVTGDHPVVSYGLRGTRDGKLIFAGDRPTCWQQEPEGERRRRKPR